MMTPSASRVHGDIGVTKLQQAKQVKAVELVEVTHARRQALVCVPSPFIKEPRQSFQQRNLVALSSMKHGKHVTKETRQPTSDGLGGGLKGHCAAIHGIYHP